MDPRARMISGFGLLSIDERGESIMGKGKTSIASDMTGELTPRSACGDAATERDYEPVSEEGELTRTLSALQRLSAEERTTLKRKLREQQQSCREPADQEKSSNEDVAPIATDSPYRVVLQKAVVEGDVEAASVALLSGADPNERDDLRHSSLHFAAAKGDIGCLQELMGSGARANVANNAGWSPLHYAVLGGHVSAVESLLRAGAYPCFRDNHLISPLHLASTQAGDRGTFRRIAELLGPSALLARDELEQTPLHVASSCGNRAAVAVLLELNADPEAIDRKGRVAGQSFLRQVSKRARAEIREKLAAAIERRNSSVGASSCDVEPPPPSRLMKRVGSMSSCEEAAPIRRPTLPAMLNLLSGFGGDGRGGGETSFGTRLASANRYSKQSS